MAIITPEIEAVLRKLYGAEDRHHHGWPHVLHMRGLALLHAHLITHLDAVLAMIDFHDAVYDSRRRDNELRSSELARRMLSRHVSGQVLEMICAGIDATARHLVPQGAPDVWQRDIAFLLDADLAILGADEQDFDEFDRNVRLEYAWLDDASWRTGRAGVMQSFLDRPFIYATPEFRDIYEDRARANIARLLAALAA